MALLTAFGSYLPTRVVANAEIARLAGCEPDWIRDVSGIEERRFAGDGETVVEMAALAALDAAPDPPQSSIGLILVSSGSGARRFPGPAAEVASRLGLAGIPALDVPVASAGSLFALALAAELCPRYGRVLVLASERMSPLVTAPPVDRNTAILFGDGAGAVLVAPDSEAAGGNPWRIAGSSLHSDGTFASELQLTAEGRFAMNGLSVILQASRKLPRTIEEVLASAGIAAAGVDAFVLHQANQNLLNKVAAALGVPRERFFSQIARLGNTSSASLLIALAAWARSPEAQSARTAVLAAFGAGFHWGAMLLLRGAG